MRTDQDHATVPAGVADVVGQMRNRLDELPAGDARRHFLGTYLRTTSAVGDAIARGTFEDPDWVEEWDVAFAQPYLEAFDAACSGRAMSRPWRLAFDAPAQLPPLRHVLLGINAHLNFDLPQALL